MKKAAVNLEMIAFFLILLILFSCEKDQKLKKTEPENETQGAKKKVTFVVSGFSRSNLPFSSVRAAAPDPTAASADSLRKYVDHLYLVVAKLYYYPFYYSLIDSVIQTSADSSFGKLSTTVIPGNYDIILLGSRGPLHLPLNYPNIGSIPLSYSVDKTTDIFLSDRNFRIGDSSSIVPLRLSRLVGQLEVQLDDAIPTDCRRVEIAVHEDAKYYLFGDYVSCTRVFGLYDKIVSRTVQAADIGKTGFKIRTMIMNTDDKVYDYSCNNQQFVTVKIKAFSDEGLLKEKDVNMVRFRDGVRTILRGQLFHTSNEFGITVDTTWQVGNEFDF